MARTPEQNRAIYQRRKARAEAAGTSVYAKRATEVQTPAGGVIATFDERRLATFLRRAGTAPVKVIVDIRHGPQVTIFGHYGWTARAMLADIRDEDDPPRIKRAILRWLDEERGSLPGPQRGSRPISRNRRELTDEDELRANAEPLIELEDLQRAQFVMVPRARAAA